MKWLDELYGKTMEKALAPLIPDNLPPLTNEEVIKYLRESTLDKFNVSHGWIITSSDGWYFNAYDDCGEIDYIECVVSPDGRRIDYEDINEELQAVFFNMFEYYY